jgi:hypothetical protein
MCRQGKGGQGDEDVRESHDELTVAGDFAREWSWVLCLQEGSQKGCCRRERGKQLGWTRLLYPDCPLGNAP